MHQDERRDPIGDPRELWNVVPTLLAAVDALTEYTGVAAAGSTLAAAWSTFSTHGRLKRLEEMFEDIRSRVKELPAGTHLNAFSADPAGMQLLHHVLERAGVAHCRERRERFANLIVSSWIADEPIEGIFDESMLFAEATERLTEAHLAVLM